MATGQRSSVQLQLIAGSGGGPTREHAATTRRTKANAKTKAAASHAARTWRLDARTREIGREGVAQAREILSQVHPPEPRGHRYAS